MTRTEFATILAYLGDASGKTVSVETARVYFAELQDLPAEVLAAAARRAVLESEFPGMPTIGRLRRLATELQRGNRLSPIEAWEMVRKALARFGYHRQAEGLASLPDDVRRTAECMGWRSLCDATEEGVIRGQFCKAYEAQQGRAEREALLPAALRQQVAAIGQSFTLELEDKRGKQ